MAGSRRRKTTTKRTSNTRGSNTSLSTIQKKKEQEKKETNNTRNLTANAQRRNNNNQNRTTIGNPRRQTGVQQQVQQKKKETTNRFGQLTKGNLQTIAGQHETTFNAIRNPMEQQYMAAEEIRKQRGEKAPENLGLYEQLLNKERSGMKETREQNLEKAAKKIKKGEKNIEKSTEELGSVGKFAADAYGGILGTATDIATGPLATLSMMSRSFGGAYNRAKEEGADDSQAALYGAAAGGMEAATEKIGNIAKPLRKAFGKGVADDTVDALLDRITTKVAKTPNGQKLLKSSGKFGLAMVTEALEEMVVEGLDPFVANAIYAEAVGQPKEFSWKDVMYAGALGAASGGAFSVAGGAVDFSNNHRQGRRVQEVFGKDGVLELARETADSDESLGKNLTGEALAEMISNGESIVAGQANDIYKTVQQQRQKDEQRNQDSRAAADNIIQKNNYVEPSVIDPQTGEELLRRNTAKKLEEVKAETINMSADMQLPDMTVDRISDSVARIMTGTARTADVNLFTLSNPAAREVYARMTGKELPNTNEATRDELWNQVAQNRVATAEAETLDVADRTKGIIEQRMGDTYEASGQAVFAKELAGIDQNDTASLEATVVSFDDFYRAGRRNLPMDDVMAMGNPFHARVPEPLRKAAYNAGREDRFIASDTAKGLQLKRGQTAKESRSMGRKTGFKGKLVTDGLSEEMRQELPATQMALLRTLARTFNINIHVVDTLAQQEGERSPNGFYVDGEVYLSMTGDRPLPYIFAHEITHHMQVYAPMEYNQLKELVRRRWGDQGGMDAAIETKRAHYAQHNVSLSYEDALDEIIADSTYEILQDEGFVDELCRSHRNIAQALLDAIKNVISKIRATLAEGELFTPAQNANLLSELGILKDFERIWTNGLMRAAENRDAVGTVSNMESVQYQLAKDKQGKNVVILDENIFDGMMPDEKPHQYIADFIASEVGKSYKILSSGYKVYIGEDLPGEFTQSKYTQSLKRNRRDRGLLYAKNQSAQNFGEVIEIADDGKYESNTKPKHVIDAKYGFYKYRSRFAIKRKDGNATEYDVELVVRHDADGKRYLYDITDIKKVGILHLTSTTQGSHGYGGANNAPQVTPTDNSIPDSQQNDNKKFSFAGESALNADNKMLAKAKEMYNDFEGSEKIRKETGWHLGEDGKWRFEIDDSQMEVFPNGDAQFRKDHPEYVRLQELYDKFWNGELTDYEQKELTELEETWGDEFGRLRKRLDDGNARLVDIVQHDVLFENYPTLKDVKVKAETLKNGTRGLFRPNKAEIALDKDLFRSEYRAEQRDKTLIHEIQHAIQEIENFAGGASPEYYQNKINELDENIRGAQHNLDLWLNDIGLNDFVIKSIKEMQNGKTLEQHWKDIQEFKRNSRYASQIEASEKELEQARNMYEEFTKGMTANEMYHYTAGEVEARNTADRLKFDSEQRKNTRPDIDSPSIQYSLADSVEETNQKAIDYFGETDSWEETGYLLTDGRQLDFSGRHWGSDGGGRREVDHRDIWDAFEPAGMQGFDAMMAFMSAGNIRIMPETPGIDIAVMPTSEQEEMLEEYIEYFGGDITLDIDNGEGVTVNSTTYPMGTSSSKILNDIRTYFTTGEKPYVSEVAMFRYSLPEEDDVYDYINSNETEFVDFPPVKDYDRVAIEVKNKSVEELSKQVEILKRDKRLTHDKVLDKASVKSEMNNLVRTLMTHSEGTTKKTDSKLVDTAVKNASIIYRAFKEGDVASAASTAYYAAEHIVENLQLIDDTAFHNYKALRDTMRTTAVTISEEDKTSIPDFEDFRKRNMGRLLIVNEGGIPVDTLYQELCEVYPELFDQEVTHPADQLMAMADVREALEPYDIMLSAEETEQLVKEAAHDLLEISVKGKPWKSWADRQKEVYDSKLKTMKAMHKEALNDLRIKERMRATRMVNAEKLKAKEYKEKQRDGKARAKANASIMKNYKWLADRLVKPTDDKHIPDEFRKSLADMLQVFDLQSARSKALEKKYGEPSQKTIKMWELKARLSKIAKEDDTGIFEYDGYVFDLMEALANRIDGLTLDQASTEDLASIDTLLKAIVTNIRNYNKTFSDDIKATISGLAEKTIEADNERIAKRGKKADWSGIVGGADKILNESMVTPRDFFELLGGGIEDCFLAMRKGFDKHVDNITKTREFFDKIFAPYNKKTKFRKRAKPGSIIESWRDGSMMQEFALESGESIKLNPAQMMSLYCLMKREQAQGHIFGSGIVASRVDNASKIKQALGAKIETQGSAVMITLADAEKIIASLTQEQVEMANQLQDYLNNECAEWGNEVSIKLYGYSKFTEKNYFPIKSADQYLDSNFENRQAAERIKNFGFTKGTVVNANNPIMIDDIFRVVGDHINKMSLYNAFAAPISDFTRVYNYKGRSDDGLITGTVKSSLEAAYGKKAIEYINNFMADVNNTTQTRTEGVVRFIDKSMANYKKATIAGNIRVALQQPTAVMRAFMLMSPKWFVNSNVNVKKNLQDMKEHCQIARWKSWGHNQVDMARDIDDIMMNKEWQYLDALTMAPYGALDNITWSTIWAAIRKETAALHPEVKIDSEEFYALCNDRASEVFDKTQVVDSVFHRSQVMRNKDSMSKMVTSFMAEPTRTFNMLRTEFVEAREMWNEGDKSKAVRLANKALSIFIINAAAVSAAAAVADALRGKDADGDGEEDDWLENFLANFWGNVNPANMIPVVSDIWGFTDGWGSSNMALEGYEALVKSIMSIPNADNKGEAIRKLAESMGMVFGIPVKNVLREIETAFKFFGIDVFAAEAGEESATEKETLLEKLNLKEGGVFDGVLNKFGFNRTEEEKLAASFDKRAKQYERSTRKMTGKEKDEYLWEEITENYTTYIKDGNFAAIKDMRAMLKAAGGDYEKFDERVLSETKTALKKSINDDVYMTYEYKNFLMEQYDLTEGKINQDMIMKSDTAKNFQIACCTNDQANMLLAMSDLYAAGLTTGEIETLYATRASAIKGRNFSTGEFAYPATGEITSGFGYRDEPISGVGNNHTGIDIAVAENTDIAAADGGKVTYAGYKSGLGYHVKIDHGNGLKSIYGHLNGYYVQKGDAVTKGQTIGLSGSTGMSTGPHLHFAVTENGQYVDPMNYFR